MVSPKTDTTLILRRVFDVPRERLYEAWTTEVDLLCWYSAAEDYEIHSVEIDLRVGGKMRASFGPSGGEPIVETDVYREIVPGKSLVFDMTLTRGETLISKTRVTVEFRDVGDGRSEIILTDVGDEAWEHAQGWRPALELLAKYLRA
jgi:uncharacterized protein YndB with AHSA1/START domain